MSNIGHHDQQTEGSDKDLPCPWCGAPQDLSELEIAVDSQVYCDACNHLYAVTKLQADVVCPKCRAAVRVNDMQLAEDAVVACPAHHAFRPSQTDGTVYHVAAERVGDGS